jgi:hypothetical protein
MTPSDPATRSFRLAPMDGLNLGLTVVVGLMVLPIPFVLLLVPTVLAGGAPPGILLMLSCITLPIAVLIVGIFVGIPVYARPLRFVLSPRGVIVIWPVRQRLIPWSTITAVERLSRAELRARYGRGMRVGAGGFLGGFGWYVTPSCTFHFYVSRIDYSVIVHIRGDKPWMITPEAPEELVGMADALRRVST